MKKSSINLNDIGNDEAFFNATATIVFIFFVMLLIVQFDPLGLNKLDNTPIYNSENEEVGKLGKLASEYEKYEESAYNYNQDVIQSDYIIKDKVKIASVEDIGNRYKVKTKHIGINDNYKYVLYFDKELADAKALKAGSKITFKGEINSMNSSYFIINKIEKVEVE